MSRHLGAKQNNRFFKVLTLSIVVLLIPGLSNAAGFTMGDPVSYTEDAPAVSVLPDFALADTSQSYAGQNVTFALDGSYGAGEVLSFTQGEPSISAGVIRVQGTTIFKGNGTTASAIGTVDPTFDGEANNLKVSFTNTFTNGDFSNGTTGWSISTQRTFLGYALANGTVVTSGATVIGGFPAPVDYLWGPNAIGGNTPSANDRDRTPMSSSSFAFNTDNGKLTLEMESGTCQTGYCVARGPRVISESSVYLGLGDAVSFDWQGLQGGDSYDVFGYLLNTENGKAIRLIDETGNINQNVSGKVAVTLGVARNESGYFAQADLSKRRTDLKDYSKPDTLPFPRVGTSVYDDTKFTDGTDITAGNYRFVFIAGTYDDNGFTGVGADFVIDNVAVSSSSDSTVTAADVQALARLLTYSNSNAASGTTSRSLTFASSLSDTGSPVSISVTSVNDAPVLASVAAHTYNDTSAVDTFTNHTGTLSATDEESDPISFGLTDATVSGTTATLTRALGIMSLNTASGAFTFTPNQGAINALDSDTSTSFTFTASDGLLSSSQTFTVNIVATVDALAGPPVISSIAPASGALTISFSAPASSGTSEIINYQYSTDGTTFFALSTASTSTSIRITTESDGVTELVNGTAYPISLKAVNSTGASVASNSVTGTPAVPVAPPPPPAPGSTAVAPTPSPSPTPAASPRPRNRPLPGINVPNSNQPSGSDSAASGTSTSAQPTPVTRPSGPAQALLEKIREAEQRIAAPEPAGSTLSEFLQQNPEVGQVSELGFVALNPAQSFVTRDGVPQQVAMAPNETLTGYLFEGPDFSLSIGATTVDGAPLAMNSAGSIVMTTNQLATVEGFGYSPSSKVVIWLFSEPVKLGELQTDARGNFQGSFAMPADLAIGNHTIQVSGVSSLGETKSVLMGVVIKEPQTAFAATIEQALGSVWTYVIALGGFGLLFLLLALLSSSRKSGGIRVAGRPLRVS